MNPRLFLFISMSLISILPLTNFLKSDLSKSSNIKDAIKTLYSLDLIEGRLNKILYSTGISIKPNDVIIGHEKWLFLGDRHSEIISKYRKGSEQEKEISEKIINTQKAWNKYFSNKGVNDFKIIVGPNKSTIYSEKLPEWAKSKGKSISNNLYKSNLYVNVINELIEAKSFANTYDRTDTHWNSFGASVAFRKLINSINHGEDFIYPSSDFGEIVQIRNLKGGDLTKFLKAQKYISDSVTKTKINHLNHEISIYRYWSNDLVYKGKIEKSGANREITFFNGTNDQFITSIPYYIYNRQALNKLKVLWLSDSFGNEMIPYMTKTFTDILYGHHSNLAGNKDLIRLVDEWRPDYIIFTVVERDSLVDTFLRKPTNHIRLSSDSHQNF